MVGEAAPSAPIAPPSPRGNPPDAALALPKVQEPIAGKQLRKVIFVPGRILNLVVG